MEGGFWKRSALDVRAIKSKTNASFEKHMDEMIVRHPKEAQLGGKPGIENKVRAYVDVLFRDDEKKKVLHPEVSRSQVRPRQC